MPVRVRNESHKESQRQWYIRNRDRVLEKSKTVEVKERRKELRKLPLNRSKKNALEAKRSGYKKFCTPIWLTKEQQNEIETLYWLAKDLELISGQKYHVDHIVPLKHKQVCGLHVPWNLQILPADINISKGNRYETF